MGVDMNDDGTERLAAMDDDAVQRRRAFQKAKQPTDIMPWMVVCEYNQPETCQYETETYRFANELESNTFAEKMADIYTTITVCRCVRQINRQ